MKKRHLTKITFTLAMIFVCLNVFSQKADKSYRIKITDNRNLQHNSFEYIFKEDSLKIIGVSDFGKSKVNYYSVKLKKKEVKAVREYLFAFPVDSLQKEYFDDFTSFGYIAADHFPRVIEIELRRGLIQSKTKATNCWVEKINTLFEFLNQYIPLPEVKLQFKKEDFKKHY